MGGTHEFLEDPRNEHVLIYVNGELVPRNEAKVSVFDSTFLVSSPAPMIMTAIMETTALLLNPIKASFGETR